MIFSTSNWPPYIYTSADGKAQGLYVDILTELFKNKLEMELVFQKVPWKRAQSNVENGQADFLVTVPTEKRLEYTVKSDAPLLEFYLRIFAYAHHPKLAKIHTISSGRDIKELGLIPVTNIGNGWHKKILIVLVLQPSMSIAK
jgi:polar amino acid transport system substrate-binding protein